MLLAGCVTGIVAAVLLEIKLLPDVFVVTGEVFCSDANVLLCVVVVVEVACVDVDVVVVVMELIVSVELFVDAVELLLLLFACVKLPLITFRGNGFGLIISTKKKNRIKTIIPDDERN